MAKQPKIRRDLVYHPDPVDEDRQLVKDPVRRQFFRYNALQIAMMQALDGRRTLADVKALLDERFESDIPLVSIERFVARVEQNLLLDVTSYTVNDEATRAQIRKRLKKRNLALRVKARDGASREGMLFEAGTRELNEGDPCKAARHFEEVLEINPNNERARQVLLSTHEAFFKVRTRSPSHARLIHVLDPHQMLVAVDRVIGRFAFGSWGLLAIVLLLLLSISPTLEVFSDPALLENVSIVDAVVFVVALELLVFFHELCHGLACVHYGGRVDDVGLMFFYGSPLPVGYCDTSDTYLFRDRRPKIVVQFAGPIGSLASQAVLFHLLALSDPSFPLWQGFALANCLVLWWNFLSVIPFVKFDAYYAVCEYVGVANLRERSFEHLRNRLGQLIFGVASPTRTTVAERRLFTVFGILSGVYTVFYLYRILFLFALPLALDLLGFVGFVIASIYILWEGGLPFLRGGIRLVRFLAHHHRTVFTPIRSVVFAVVIILVVLGLSAPWPLHVDGSLEVEPLQRVELRVDEPGLIAELAVRTGDRVEAGQVIATLRSDQLIRDRALAEQDLAIARGKLALLREGSRREAVQLAAAQARTDRVRSSVAARELHQAHLLRNRDVGTGDDLQRARASAAHATGQARVAAATAQLVSASARDEELAELEAHLKLCEGRLVDLDARVQRLEIKSPISGVVVTPRIEDRVGRWLESGAELLTIHDTTLWKARIVPDRTEPIAGIAVGQRVIIAAHGDPHSQLETLVGEILPPQEQGSSITVYTTPLSHDGWRSGMTGQARIYAPERSIAYRVFVLPLARLWEQELPSF
jgi:multidrug efflux pump subunit AcrA (membrane-fusion protein)